MRDMYTLGQAGIPIQSEYGAHGGYLDFSVDNEKDDYCMFKLVRMEELIILKRNNIIDHEAVNITIHDERKVYARWLERVCQSRGI